MIKKEFERLTQKDGNLDANQKTKRSLTVKITKPIKIDLTHLIEWKKNKFSIPLEAIKKELKVIKGRFYSDDRKSTHEFEETICLLNIGIIKELTVSVGHFGVRFRFVWRMLKSCRMLKIYSPEIFLH